MAGMLSIATRNAPRPVLRLLNRCLEKNASEGSVKQARTYHQTSRVLRKTCSRVSGSVLSRNENPLYSQGIRYFRATASLYSDVLDVSAPDFPDSVSEGDVRWEKKKGDHVATDEIVVEIETDKTAIPVMSPANGIIEECYVENGATVKAKTKLFKLKLTGDAPAKQAAPEKPAAPEPAAAPSPAAAAAPPPPPPPRPAAAGPPPPPAAARPQAPPAQPVSQIPVAAIRHAAAIEAATVKMAGLLHKNNKNLHMGRSKRLAENLKLTMVALEESKQSDKVGAYICVARRMAGLLKNQNKRIDLYQFRRSLKLLKDTRLNMTHDITPLRPFSGDSKKPKGAPPRKSKPGDAKPADGKIPPADPTKEISGTRTEQRVKMNRMRLKIAERLKSAQNTNAMLTTFNEIDMTNIMEFRKANLEQFQKKYGLKFGFMSAFLKASAYALQDQPVVNAVIDGTEIVYRDFVDISVAVATPKGLVVPVVRNVERMNYADIELAMAALAEKARNGRLAVEDMDGGTFTVSNGGVFGSLMGTPIINPPQSAILGMHAIVERPVAINKQVVIRPMMYVALTYDHRLIDGREAVLFLRKIKAAVEDPRIIIAGI